MQAVTDERIGVRALCGGTDFSRTRGAGFILQTGQAEACPQCLNQPLPNLHRVRRRPFADLIAAHKQLDPAAVIAADVLANSADQHIILAAGFIFVGVAQLIFSRVEGGFADKL